MYKKESRQFFISVEGINCERMYFCHLAKCINESENSTYNLKIDPKKKTPFEYAKRNAHLPREKTRKNEIIPYLHIQDIEDYYDQNQKKKFYEMIDDMRKAEKQFGITYKLGYSNYTFELWMLLHVTDMRHAVQDRYAYLPLINRYFNRNYTDIDDYKKEEEFENILKEFVTLDSIKQAIRRADAIEKSNAEGENRKETYKSFQFYHNNPDLTVHKVVRLIFDVCDVK